MNKHREIEQEEKREQLKEISEVLKSGKVIEDKIQAEEFTSSYKQQ